MADHSHEHEDDGEVHVHVHETKFYAGILGALLLLTVITVAVSYVDIDGFLALGREVEGVGAWNLGVAILIATMKATLVVLFFMHLRDDKRFNAVVFVAGLLFIGVFFVYTMNDTATRGQTGDAFNGVSIDPETGVRAPGGIDGPIPGEVLEEGLTLPEGETEAGHGADAEPGATEHGAAAEGAAAEPSAVATPPAQAAPVEPAPIPQPADPAAQPMPAEQPIPAEEGAAQPAPAAAPAAPPAAPGAPAEAAE